MSNHPDETVPTVKVKCINCKFYRTFPETRNGLGGSCKAPIPQITFAGKLPGWFAPLIEDLLDQAEGGERVFCTWREIYCDAFETTNPPDKI